MALGYFNRKGEPIELMEWKRLLEDLDYKIVIRLEEAREDMEILISTVWLGLDHNWGPGPPLIFETMVFIHEPGKSANLDHPHDQKQWRWSAEEEAKEGHDLIIKAYRENLDPDEVIQAWREAKRKEVMI